MSLGTRHRPATDRLLAAGLRLTALCRGGPTANSAQSRRNERTHGDRANAVLAYRRERGSGHKRAHDNIVTDEEPAGNQGLLSSRGISEGYSVMRQAQVQAAGRRQQGDFVAACGNRQHDPTATSFLGVQTEIEGQPIQRHFPAPGQPR